MERIIDLGVYPVDRFLGCLLRDKTTKKNIIFATGAYEGFSETDEITEEALRSFNNLDIQPRVAKARQEQQERTRQKAEVFTPSWICNKMNNHCDEEWFGRAGVFNYEKDQSWEVNPEKVEFAEPDGWKAYVDSRRLEITCGEAPYIVSRYDAASGEAIDIDRRIGILDRKLRIVNENTQTEEDWIAWAARAYQSVYGYEFQGDNLLIARINLLMSYVDYYQARWHKEPEKSELSNIVNIIVWNLWQMDGITGTLPYTQPKEEDMQVAMSLDIFADLAPKTDEEEPEETDCIIYDWRARAPVKYSQLKEK